MRRLFFQTKLYDYSTIKEAEKHIDEMRQKGWYAKRQEDNSLVFKNSQDEYPYSVEFFKER
jgi:hypothetical protein